MNISLNKTFLANTHGRDFIVGDIHGQLDDLIQQLKEELFDFSNDRLFALGDLIDRGMQSKECLELLQKPWFFSVIGNHEYIFSDQFSKQEFDTSSVNVGNQRLKKWKGSAKKLTTWFELIHTKPPKNRPTNENF
jgi:serine/threonine protein phosphatase 1